jgi:hypothetical protein
MSCTVYAIHPAHSESPGCIVLVSIVPTVCGFQVVSKNPRNRNPFGLIVACVFIVLHPWQYVYLSNMPISYELNNIK